MANNVKLKLLNEHFQCGICQGYIIDATTISECLHSFCKSCIFHFVESIDHRCPTCNQNLEDLNNCISSDSSLQRLIYQLIPNLLENELERRQNFYQYQTNEPPETIFNEDSLVSLKLFNIQKSNKLVTEIKIEPNSIDDDLDDESENNNYKANPNKEIENEIITVKYIQCIAQTPIRIISRMLRNKYAIPDTHSIRIYCMGHRLSEKENLLQVFTSFIKSKNDLLELRYELIKRKNQKFKKDFQKENARLVDSLSRSLDIQADNSKTNVNKNSATSNKKSADKELIFKPSVDKADLNETSSVYYSDENSYEGKLTMDDKKVVCKTNNTKTV